MTRKQLRARPLAHTTTMSMSGHAVCMNTKGKHTHTHTSSPAETAAATRGLIVRFDYHHDQKTLLARPLAPTTTVTTSEHVVCVITKENTYTSSPPVTAAAGGSAAVVPTPDPATTSLRRRPRLVWWSDVCVRRGRGRHGLRSPAQSAESDQ